MNERGEIVDNPLRLNRDLVLMADALMDLLYVTFGTLLELGMGSRAEAMFAHVHASNMSKVGEDGKPILRADGKILKGPNFFPPDLAPFLRENWPHDDVKKPEELFSFVKLNPAKEIVVIPREGNIRVNPTASITDLVGALLSLGETMRREGVLDIRITFVIANDLGGYFTARETPWSLDINQAYQFESEQDAHLYLGDALRNNDARFQNMRMTVMPL